VELVRALGHLDASRSQLERVGGCEEPDRVDAGERDVCCCLDLISPYASPRGSPVAGSDIHWRERSACDMIAATLFALKSASSTSRDEPLSIPSAAASRSS
jgi:hypothetical protein